LLTVFDVKRKLYLSYLSQVRQSWQVEISLYSVVYSARRLWLSCLGTFLYLLRKTIHYLVFPFFRLLDYPIQDILIIHVAFKNIIQLSTL